VAIYKTSKKEGQGFKRSFIKVVEQKIISIQQKTKSYLNIISESYLLFCAFSYVDPEAVVGCDDGAVRVFDMYSRRCSQIIRYFVDFLMLISVQNWSATFNI